MLNTECTDKINVFMSYFSFILCLDRIKMVLFDMGEPGTSLFDD